MTLNLARSVRLCVRPSVQKICFFDFNEIWHVCRASLQYYQWCEFVCCSAFDQKNIPFNRDQLVIEIWSNLLLVRIMSQYWFAHWHLSGSVNSTAGLQVASRAHSRRWRHATSSLIIAPQRASTVTSRYGDALFSSIKGSFSWIGVILTWKDLLSCGDMSAWIKGVSVGNPHSPENCVIGVCSFNE